MRKIGSGCSGNVDEERERRERRGEGERRGGRGEGEEGPKAGLEGF